MDEHTRQVALIGDGSWLRTLAVLAALGIQMRPGGDGSCDDEGYAELARRYPIPVRHPVRRTRRGGVPVHVEAGTLTLVDRLQMALEVSA